MEVLLTSFSLSIEKSLVTKFFNALFHGCDELFGGREMHREMNFQVKESCTLFSFLFQVSFRKKGNFSLQEEDVFFRRIKKFFDKD